MSSQTTQERPHGRGIRSDNATEQVAVLLGMNVQMVRKAAREGTLPAYRLPGGRAYKFFREELYEWLKKHPATAGDEGDDLAE